MEIIVSYICMRNSLDLSISVIIVSSSANVSKSSNTLTICNFSVSDCGKLNSFSSLISSAVTRARTSFINFLTKARCPFL